MINYEELDSLDTTELEKRQARIIREIMLSQFELKPLSTDSLDYLKQKLLVIDNIIDSRRG